MKRVKKAQVGDCLTIQLHDIDTVQYSRAAYILLCKNSVCFTSLKKLQSFIQQNTGEQTPLQCR